MNPLWAGVMVSLLLAGCASGPADNISLIPGDQVATQTAKDGLFTQPVEWKKTKPGCDGNCPSIEVKSLAFPGVPILTRLVDHALAIMTGVSATSAPPYTTLAEFEQYFWQTAAPRDAVFLSARTRYMNRNLSVIELNSQQRITGAAHGITATQFLNWDNNTGKVLGIRNVLVAGQYDAYLRALRQAHQQWLETQPDAKGDPEAYLHMWPFQPSDNFAFTDQGLVVKYDAYAIAPYAAGLPELTIPYEQLKGILKPEYLPSDSIG